MLNVKKKLKKDYYYSKLTSRCYLYKTPAIKLFHVRTALHLQFKDLSDRDDTLRSSTTILIPVNVFLYVHI